MEVLSDAATRFAPGATMWAGNPAAGEARPVRVDASRAHRGGLLVRFRGVADRSAAERLHGMELWIGGADARRLGDDEYWPGQLEGLVVVDQTGERRGLVEAVVPGVAHDQLSVRLADGRAVLVPAVKALLRVELAAGRVRVTAIPGLLDP